MPIWEQLEGLHLLWNLHKVNPFTHSLLHKGVSTLLDVTILCNLLIHSVSNDKWHHCEQWFGKEVAQGTFIMFWDWQTVANCKQGGKYEFTDFHSRC
jgi:hypothetical protein